MDVQTITTVVAGGLFGVILGKFLETAPDWVFWALVAAFFVAMLYLIK